MKCKTVADSLKFDEVIALAPCPYKRCAAPTNIPCVGTDIPHKSRAQAAFRVKRQNDATDRKLKLEREA